MTYSVVSSTMLDNPELKLEPAKYSLTMLCNSTMIRKILNYFTERFDLLYPTKETVENEDSEEETEEIVLDEWQVSRESLQLLIDDYEAQVIEKE